jgi:hypothetical protein
MFRKNEQHRQPPLFGSLDELPPKVRQRLDKSWAGDFYRECFCRLDESPFEVLYASVDSRPNTPVNVLLSFEILKAGFGWSDVETHEHLSFDVQVRYAVGLRDLSEGHFELRTVYNFRKRLYDYYCETGENLLDQVFEQVSDAQLRAFGLDTSKARMDSTFVTSNIQNFGRLQLLVEVLRRVYSMLSKADQAHYDELLYPYVRPSSSARYVQRVSSQEGRQRIREIGQVMATLVEKLAAKYGEEPTYHLLKRVYEEHFVEEDDNSRPRQPDEMPKGTLCAPDDLEATARFKRNTLHKGFVTNATETCAPGNPFQMIVKVQTLPNIVSDVKLLETVLQSLWQRLGIDLLWTDGGYNNEHLYNLMRALGIQHLQTGIQGHSSKHNLPLSRYEIKQSETGEPISAVCPNGQESPVVARSSGWYRAYYRLDQCAGCPYASVCLAKAGKTQRVLRFREYDIELAKRRRNIQKMRRQGVNPRAAVESTVYSLKRRFGPKLPVRGLFRVQVLMLSSALMANVRRIHRGWSRIRQSPCQSTAG